MKRSIQSAIVLGLSATLAGPVAHADETGYYGYLATGRTKSDRKAEIDSSIINAGINAATLTSSADDTDTGWKFQAGYRFNRHFAVEGGYADLGKFTYDASATLPATRHSESKVRGWNIDAVGYLPITDTVVGFAKLGAFIYDIDTSCSGTGVPCSNPNRSANRTGTRYGLGVDWTFSRAWFARAEYEVYSRVGESLNATGTTGTTRADVKMGSIGIGYRF